MTATDDTQATQDRTAALGLALRFGADPETAAMYLGLEAPKFARAAPVTPRQPQSDATVPAPVTSRPPQSDAAVLTAARSLYNLMVEASLGGRSGEADDLKASLGIILNREGK